MGEDGVFALTPKQARSIRVRGPLLVEHLGDAGVKFLAPAPQDALWFKESGIDDGRRIRHRLAPADLSAGCRVDGQLGSLELLAFATGEPLKIKATQGPAFWAWSDLEAWLSSPPTQKDELTDKWGLPELTRERRTHVAIDRASKTAQEGLLFGTEMLRFVRLGDDKLSKHRRLGLAFECGDRGLKRGVCTLGGERRLSFLTPLQQPLPPCLPDEVYSGATRLRLQLLTPGLFDLGFRPGDKVLKGARLVAAAVGRPEIISGWDYAAKPRGPKPTRRMAPSGSVYWVELERGTDPVDWARERWMKSICDKEQDRLDGFGLCVVGRA